MKEEAQIKIKKEEQNEEPQIRLSGKIERIPFGQVQYTTNELNYLQSALQDKLGTKYITSRQGPGGQTVHYLETHTVIALANETFGFNGWSSQVMALQEDFIDTNGSKYNVGFSAIVRITLKDGSYREDTGYGATENQPRKGAAIEIAKKKAISDGMKRAFRQFGFAMGLSIYDKGHTKQLKKRHGRSSKVSVGVDERPQNPHFSDHIPEVKKESPPSPQKTNPSISNGSAPISTPGNQLNALIGNGNKPRMGMSTPVNSQIRPNPARHTNGRPVGPPPGGAAGPSNARYPPPQQATPMNNRYHPRPPSHVASRPPYPSS